MKVVLKAAGKTVSLLVLAFAFLALSQTVAWADPVTIAGSTTGSFSGLTTGLSFAGNTFNVTTQNGIAALSGLQSLGTFTQNTFAGDLNGAFTLTVNFSLPTGITGGNSTTYTALVTGSVADLDNGGSLVTFNSAQRAQTFTFSSPTGAGVFTLLLPDFVAITSGRTAELHGFILGAQQSAPVPEPATILLLGTGMTGLGAMMRRRRRKLE